MNTPPCFFCKEDTLYNECRNCIEKYDLRSVATFYNRSNNNYIHECYIELLDKTKIYTITYNVSLNTTYINFISLATRDNDAIFHPMITSFMGLRITPDNIRLKLPIYLLLS